MAAGGDIHSYSGAAICKVKLCWEFLCFIKMRNDNNSVCSFIHLNCQLQNKVGIGNFSMYSYSNVFENSLNPEFHFLIC